MQENGLGDYLALGKIEKLHSNMELILAVFNKYCDKHNEEPRICGAIKEARALLGTILKIGGLILAIWMLIKFLLK